MASISFYLQPKRRQLSDIADSLFYLIGVSGGSYLILFGRTGGGGR